jgi:hypothetical protein
MKKYLILLMVAVILAVPAASGAAPLYQGQDYTVQADDWLSKLAEKFLGDVLAYPAITYYTKRTLRMIVTPKLPVLTKLKSAGRSTSLPRKRRKLTSAAVFKVWEAGPLKSARWVLYLRLVLSAAARR